LSESFSQPFIQFVIKNPLAMTTKHALLPHKTLQPAADTSFFRIVLIAVLGYEAAGALLGAVLLVIKPDGSLMDMPIDLMHGFFRDFFIPGSILFGMGVITAAAFVTVVRRSQVDWLMAIVALCGFAIWFIVEIVVVEELHWLHLMWGLPIVLGLIALIPLLIDRSLPERIQPLLLVSGIISSLWYLAINIYVPAEYDGYSLSQLTVSELSAIGSPTRTLWILLVWIYPVLLAGFGFGILETAGRNRSLRKVGYLLIAYSLFNLYWPPMHMRGEETTLTDLMHIVWASVTVLLMIAMMIFGAIAIKGGFRFYTIVSIITHLVFGILTFQQAPNIPTNGPTPTIGTLERINIAVFMLWIIILAIVQLTTNSRVNRNENA
jgi:hypothetical protein